MKLTFGLLTLLCLGSCQPPSSENRVAGDTSPALLFASPPSADTVQLFGEGIISTAHGERDLALAPRQDELFYTLTVSNQYSAIIHLTKDSIGWSQPQVASFSGHYRDLEPAFSPDGNRLFFASARPPEGEGEAKDVDIWYVDRTEKGWGNPQRMDTVINTSGNEYYPSVAANGNLYFTAERSDAIGLEDLYVSRYTEGRYQAPENLSEAINSETYEFNAYISPDEQFILFSSYGREDGQGGGDLYLSQRATDGSWQPAISLPSFVNSPAPDYCPFVTPDQQYLFFSSNRSLLPTRFSEAPTYQSLVEQLSQPQSGKDDIYWTRFQPEEWMKE